MVSFGSGGEKAPRYEDLPVADQFRVSIGKVIANAMQAAMGIASRPAYQMMPEEGKAEIMASITVSYVARIEDVIAEFGDKGRDE